MTRRPAGGGAPRLQCALANSGHNTRAIQDWLYLFQDCDGLEAADNHVFTGYDLYEKVRSGAYNEVTQTYQGADSPAGCGANSVYQVLWSVTPA